MAALISRKSLGTGKVVFHNKLYQACYDNDTENICLILKAHKYQSKILSKSTDDGIGPPMNFAALHGKLDVVKILFEEFNADITLEDANGCNPLVSLINFQTLYRFYW